jgi:hypothetical protein
VPGQHTPPLGNLTGGTGIPNQIALLAWYKSHGTSMQTTPFELDDTEFSRDLALILGLTRSQIEQINSALGRTKQTLEELKFRAATAQHSADGKSLLVTLPPLTVENSRVYSELLTTMKTVLGPARYQVFNELTGDQFEQAFGSFGLNTDRFDLTLQPANTNGVSMYTFKHTSIWASNSSESINEEKMWPELIKTRYPILARFLPQEPAKPGR